MRPHGPAARTRATCRPPGSSRRRFERLKKERNAVILAHYYQESEIQDLADHVGDSLGLARAAQKTDADVIAFCGVHFMAEVAKILNPQRTVVLPDLAAGCSLADGCPPDQFRRFIDQHPGHFVVSYINCSAAVKAMSDVIVHLVERGQDRRSRSRRISRSSSRPTSTSARFVMKQTGRDMVVWQGTCIVHETFSEKKIIDLLVRNPGAELIAHPECEESVLRHAKYIGSTTGLIKYAVSSPAQTLIVATEEGVLHQMKARRAATRRFIAAPPEDESCACNQCPHMRRNTMEKLYLCLRDLTPTHRDGRGAARSPPSGRSTRCWRCRRGSDTPARMRTARRRSW